MLQNAATKAVPGDYDRKWMFDDYFDLYVWYQPDGAFFGFQLCYDKAGDQRALTWTQTGGYRHTRIDSGESKPTANRSPILTGRCPFRREPLRAEFLQRSIALEAGMREFVLAKLDGFQPPSSQET